MLQAHIVLAMVAGVLERGLKGSLPSIVGLIMEISIRLDAYFGR
jgi:hypothetical protein